MNDLVLIKGKEAVCDSLEVAERFHKKHKSVLRSIDNIVAQNCATKGMFHLSEYKAGDGQVYRKFFMNRDGFSLLTMGFTGSKALQWKLDYIKAFNTMERLLQEQQSSEWKFFRQQSKGVRLAETDTLQELVEYAKTNGSTNYQRIYSNYTRLANKTVGIKSIKDATTMQLNYLMLVENIFIQIIHTGIAKGRDYHDIYSDCRTKATQLSSTITIGAIA